MHICFIGRHSMAPKLEDNSLDAPIFKAFAKKFEHVSLIYKATGDTSSITQSGNINLHLVNGNGLGIPTFVSNALGKIKKIDSQQPIDVISTSDALGAGLVGVFAKKILKSKPKLVVQIQGQTLKLPAGSYGWLRRYVTRKLAIWVAKRADKVRVVSQEIRTQAINLGIEESKIFLVYNRCDTDLFDPKSNKVYGQQIRDDLKISNQSIVISFIGRLESHKGIYELLESIPLLDGIQPHLLLIGNPIEQVELKKIIKERKLTSVVHIIGIIPFNQIPHYLAATDIFILPSKHEGTPRVILEAMAMELPVIATPIGGIPEVIESGKTGFLLKDTRPYSIAEALGSLIKQPDRRFEIGHAARNHVITNYNFKEQADALINLHTSMGLE